MMQIDPEYIGYELLRQGFKKWFLYMFRMIEQKPFIKEPIHNDMLELFEDVYKQKKNRVVLNVPPRSAKTCMSKYFVVYSLTKNPKSNIIYTSYSQTLLSDIARGITAILQNPIYKAMYNNNTALETFETNPIDDFWRDYLKHETQKELYTSKKIVSSSGGVVLFASVGSQITGFGVGIRGAKQYSGCLIIDDANKPADVRSEVLRNKVLTYYEETLLSRLNQSNAPIINIQQRLHLQDLTGFLEERYKFDVLKKPLIDEEGKCIIPSQYTEERIEELKVNNYMFQAQYMQNPIILGGGVFKHEWWKFYQDPNVAMRKVYITADTACKTKEWNDFTAIGCWGLTMDNKLYLLDLIHKKMEAPELESTMLGFFNKHRLGVGNRRLSAIYIEDKASGTGLIQNLKKRGGLPIIPYMPESDKLQRANDVVGYVQAGNVHLPYSENDAISKECLKELDEFSADMSHTHDDIVDCFTMAINEAFNKKGLF